MPQLSLVRERMFWMGVLCVLKVNSILVSGAAGVQGQKARWSCEAPGDGR